MMDIRWQEPVSSSAGFSSEYLWMGVDTDDCDERCV